jgi:hypothetical protein
MSIALGLPKGILPTPEVAMSAGCVSQLVRVQPNNVSSISSSPQALALTANGYQNNLVFPSQLIQFSIPCGQGKHVWIDSEKSSISYRVNYALTTVGVNYTGASAFLQDAASSWINRIVHIGPNGQTVDDVVNAHISEHLDHLLNYNTTDRDVFGAQFGFLAEKTGTAQESNINNTQGHKIESMTGVLTSTANCYYSYEYPLASALLGKYAKGYFPAGSVNKLDVQLYTNSQVPVSFSVGTTLATTAAQVTFTIDNISLNLYYLTLDAESARMLGSPKIHYLHGITQRTASSTLAAGTSGYINTLIGLRGKSCRGLYTRICDNGATSAANSINGVFDSKMPMCSQLNYLLQGKDRYPQFPHNTQILPSSVLNRTLMSGEKFKEWEQRSSFIPTQFFKYVTTASAPTAANGYDQNVVNAGSTTSIIDLSTFVFGEDLRKVHNSQVLDGYDLTVTANHFLETNIIQAPSNTQSIFFTGRFDIIFEIDMEQGTINYRM